MSSDRCDHRDCISSCGTASHVLPGSDTDLPSEVVDALVDHLRVVLALVQTRPAIAQLVGFEEYHAQVSRLVLHGGAAFAADIVGGLPLPVASERHSPDHAALLAAADFILLVTPAVLAVAVVGDYVRAGVGASVINGVMREGASVDDADVATVPAVAVEREAVALRPRHQAMPGRGWPVTSLAPPVAA